MYVENVNNGFHCQKGKEIMFTYFKTLLKITFLKTNLIVYSVTECMYAGFVEFAPRCGQ